MCAPAADAAREERVPVNTGNFVICYDVSDAAALAAVADFIAPCTMMVQRSVYWLRGSLGELTALFERCASLLAERDRLWAYPLRQAGDLWHVGRQSTSVLPISIHRWDR